MQPGADPAYHIMYRHLILSVPLSLVRMMTSGWPQQTSYSDRPGDHDRGGWPLQGIKATLVALISLRGNPFQRKHNEGGCYWQRIEAPCRRSREAFLVCNLGCLFWGSWPLCWTDCLDPLAGESRTVAVAFRTSSSWQGREAPIRWGGVRCENLQCIVGVLGPNPVLWSVDEPVSRSRFSNDQKCKKCVPSGQPWRTSKLQ